MQESSNNHNSIETIETIEIIEAINSTEPNVNVIPLQTNIESIEITESSNSTDPKACYIPTVQINTNLGTQPQNSTNVASKHLVPCPFLRRKGHCLKGSKCDFSRQFGPQQPAQLYQRYNFPSFWRDPIPYPFHPNFPPVMSFPTFHPQTNYPGSYPQSLMGIPTRSSRFNKTQPAISFPTPHPFELPWPVPPPQMEIPTGPPRP
jgi:hypothetical protein